MAKKTKKAKKARPVLLQKAGALLASYRLGVDFWALGLFGALFILNLACWCAMPGIYLCALSFADMYATAYVLQAVACLILVFVKHRDTAKNPNFSSAFFLFFALAAVLSAVAWIFYLSQYINWAVLLFVAVFPTVTLVLLAVLRKNPFPALPLAVSFALWLAAVIPMMA